MSKHGFGRYYTGPIEDLHCSEAAESQTWHPRESQIMLYAYVWEIYTRFGIQLLIEET